MNIKEFFDNVVRSKEPLNGPIIWTQKAYDSFLKACEKEKRDRQRK